jgi:hypothetical protein
MTTRALPRAIVRGENAANTNLDVALDVLYGPIYDRMLNDRFSQDVIDAAVAPVSSDGLDGIRKRRRRR